MIFPNHSNTDIGGRPLKNGGWWRILSFWVSSYFQGRTVGFGVGSMLDLFKKLESNTGNFISLTQILLRSSTTKILPTIFFPKIPENCQQKDLPRLKTLPTCFSKKQQPSATLMWQRYHCLRFGSFVPYKISSKKHGETLMIRDYTFDVSSLLIGCWDGYLG